MKIVIDISPLKSLHKTRGIGMYTKSLVEHLTLVDKKNSYILTSKSADVRDVDVVHYPYFDFFFHTLPIRKKQKTVVTIHDVIPLIFPKLYPKGMKGKIKFLFQRLSLRSVNAVITDSESSKADIMKYLSVPEKIISVIPLAAAKEFKPQSKTQAEMIKKKYHLPEKYFLYVGDVNPTKNLIRLIDAFFEISKKNSNWHLVLVGRVFYSTIKEVKQIREHINSLHLEYRVHIHSNVPLDPTSDIVSLYTLANWYIQPSLYEGFGLPVLEAFASQTPVLCSETSSLPEVAANAAIYFNPNKTKDIVSVMNQAIQMNEAERRRMIQKGKEQVKQYSWRKTALSTIKVYKHVLKVDSE